MRRDGEPKGRAAPKPGCPDATPGSKSLLCGNPLAQGINLGPRPPPGTTLFPEINARGVCRAVDPPRLMCDFVQGE